MRKVTTVSSNISSRLKIYVAAIKSIEQDHYTKRTSDYSYDGLDHRHPQPNCADRKEYNLSFMIYGTRIEN